VPKWEAKRKGWVNQWIGGHRPRRGRTRPEPSVQFRAAMEDWEGVARAVVSGGRTPTERVHLPARGDRNGRLRVSFVVPDGRRAQASWRTSRAVATRRPAGPSQAGSGRRDPETPRGTRFCRIP
jgi:hypothetical protein